MNPRYERLRWRIFGVTWLIYASLYLTRQSFTVAKVGLASDSRLAFGREQFGLIDSAFAATYMFGQFVFGPLGDRLGPRRILLFGIALSVLAAVATGFSTTLVAFIAFAVLQGVAQSTGWTNCSKTMSAWFSLAERGRVIGWWCTHYTVGSVVALWFAGWLMGTMGNAQSAGVAPHVTSDYWPAAYWGPAAVLCLVWVVAWVLLRNRPEDVGLPPIEQYHGEPESILKEEDRIHPLPEGSWNLIGEVLTTPSIWMLATAYFSVKLARYVFIFWGPKYVSESLGSDAYTSALTAAALPLGGLVGVIGIGYASDVLFQARRAPAVVLSLVATAVVMLFGLTTITNIWVMAAFFFLIGVFLFGPDSMISATASIDFGTKRGAGTATGFVNGIGSIGGILGAYLPGKITTESDWTPMFAVFLVGLLVSAVLLLPLWRTKPPTS